MKYITGVKREPETVGKTLKGEFLKPWTPLMNYVDFV